MAKREKITRQTQLAKREDVAEQLRKVFRTVSDGFRKQSERADESMDWWDIYNCKLTSRQFYSGNSQLFVPLVHNGLEARKTRFINTLFPQTGRYVEVTSEDGEVPHATMALLEMYVERAELKTKVAPALILSGDVEGQLTLCATWGTKTRHTVSRETKPIKIGGVEHPDLEPVETLKEETIEDSGPEADVVADADVLILPATAESVEAALDCGGSVTTICRWTEARVEELIDDGEIDEDLSAELLLEMRRGEGAGHRDTAKHLADAAGIRASGKFVLVYRVWAKIKVDKVRRLVLAYFSGNGDDAEILGCKLCPYWCDKADILSVPVRKMPGVAKGMSLVKPCADMQYAANDAVNEGMDSATYSMLPVVLTDPVKNPRVDSMVMDLMAVWQTSPNDTKILEFPQLYQHAFDIVRAAEQYIMATLSVNAAMLPQSTGVPGRKRNQAEIAMEQQIDLLGSSVEVGAVEGLLSELLRRWAEYDAQFRDDVITVRSVGELGVKAQMEEVPPLQMGKRWRFRWFGAEVARTTQQIQQQIAAINVLMPMSQNPSVAQAGYRMNLVPFIRTVTESAFGPRLAPEIFEKISDKIGLDPELENSLLSEHMDLSVSPSDDDPKHMQNHQPLLQSPDPVVAEMARRHMAAHQQQMVLKQAAQQMQAMQQAMQGGGGGGGQGPRPGAQPAGPRLVKSPPGAIHPDQMRGGAVQPPRRAG
jgi:hypothetical protein